jgi:nicotinate-nucleotide adenylyltransferase
MIAHDPRFEISRLEIDRPGPHYTIETVKLLKQQEPDAEIILLIGGDSLADLPTWRFAPELITAVSKLGIMRRPGDFTDLSNIETQLPGITQKIQFIEALLQPVSSRELRRRIQSGEMARYYLAPEVYEYIEKNNLYR